MKESNTSIFKMWGCVAQEHSTEINEIMNAGIDEFVGNAGINNIHLINVFFINNEFLTCLILSICYILLVQVRFD